MTPEERQLLKETAELVKENHSILKSIRRSNRISSFFRAIYWLIIVGTAFGTYFFLQPYIDPLIKVIDSTKSNVQTIRDFMTRTPSLPTQANAKQ